MAADVNIFSKLDESIKTKVKMGNGKLIEAKGKGIAAVQTRKGTRYVKDVLLVPSLEQNLLSVGQMIQNGYSLHFENKLCRICDDKNNEIGRIKMSCNRNFPIQWHAHNAMSAEVNHSNLWHKRFGHYNYDALRKLHEKKMILDLSLLQHQKSICEGCMLGKQHRNSFPKESLWRAKEPLQLVHTDVCGPMRTPSHNGNMYFLLFIDDFSRMTWVYFMKGKPEVLEIFKKFKRAVEIESGFKMKALRSDRGMEFNSQRFNKFCDEEGLKHQLTVAYSPQQNGVAERKNRTVMEMA